MPPSAVFAGMPLDPPWPGGRLHHCRTCGLGFRYPTHDDATYASLYAQAEGDVWLGDRLRADQALVKQAVLQHAQSCTETPRVLDVGCYNGSLLAALGERFERHGIEASAAAADVARSRGIHIVGKRFSDLSSLSERYDLITAVDVIEHVNLPHELLRQMAGLLAPGGQILISTGALDAPPWRASGGRFWYGQFPEHIAFVSLAWAQRIAPALGLSVASSQRFNYLDTDLLWRLKRRLQFWWRLRASASQPGLPEPLAEPGIFRDHVLLVFEQASRTAP